jgi:hypothetical protein
MACTNATRSESTSTAANPPSKRPISPAARKFAEYLARRLAPMIEYSAKQQLDQTSGENKSNRRKRTDEGDVDTAHQ